MKNTLFQSEVADIYHDTDLDALVLEYKNPVKGYDNFVSINEEALKHYKTINVNKFIADIRLMGVISVESQSWLAENIVPKLISASRGGVLHLAQYMDEKDIFVKVAANSVKSRSEKNLSDNKNFIWHQYTNKIEMENWLKSVN